MLRTTYQRPLPAVDPHDNNTMEKASEEMTEENTKTSDDIYKSMLANDINTSNELARNAKVN